MFMLSFTLVLVIFLKINATITYLLTILMDSVNKKFSAEWIGCDYAKQKHNGKNNKLQEMKWTETEECFEWTTK